jgi:hypothetical protein
MQRQAALLDAIPCLDTARKRYFAAIAGGREVTTISVLGNFSRKATDAQIPLSGTHGSMPVIWRFVKLALLCFAILFVAPVSLRLVLFLFEDWAPNAHSYDVELADMSSTGLLPAPKDHPSARVLIMSVPTSGEKGKFLSHHWVVLKNKHEASWRRYEVLGFSSRDQNGQKNGRWLDNQPTMDRYGADARWFGRSPAVLSDAEGAVAEAIIPRIEAVINNYEAMAGHYRVWPGPNSNTFVAVVLRAVPELRATLPPTAVGKDFRPGPYLGPTDSRTGLEANLWGVVGVKIGWIEGVEINVLGLIAGLDLRKPALKLPGFGRIGLVK